MVFLRVLYPQRGSLMGPRARYWQLRVRKRLQVLAKLWKPSSLPLLSWWNLPYSFQSDYDGLTVTERTVTSAHRPQLILLLANYRQIRVNSTWWPFSGWSLFHYWETLNRHMRVHFFVSRPTYIQLSWHSVTIDSGSYCCLILVWICLPLFRNQRLDLRCEYQLTWHKSTTVP